MDAKPWWESKAQWGILTAMIGFILQAFGIAFDAAAATEVVWSFVQAIGLALAFYGNSKRAVPLDLKQILPGLRLK